MQAVGAAILGGILSIFALPGDAEAARRRRLLKTLWAVVDETGGLVRGKGVTGTGESANSVYHITFNRDVSGCAYSATLDEGFWGEISAYSSPNTPREVNVVTRHSDSSRADRPFYLVVHC